MPSFQYIQPNEEQKALMQEFRDEYQKLADKIKQLPPSRGVASAMTNLEQSSFWLNKAIVQNDAL